tara:strand:+ start:1534 stop:2772 length:1239 start_codon:yes stop_codon:yes gene_type:complete
MVFKIKNLKVIANLIIVSPILILLIFIRLFKKIEIIEIETRAIGHYSFPIEIFLCEIQHGIHEKKKYLAFRNRKIANKYLYDKIKINFVILPRIILQPIFKFFNHKYIHKIFGKYFLSDFRHWTRHYSQNNPSQLIDIHKVLKRSNPTLSFKSSEINNSFTDLNTINLNKEDNFVCLHPRTPSYYIKRKKIKNFDYQLRDSTEMNFLKSVDFLKKEKIKTVLLGEDLNNLGINFYNFLLNSEIIKYNVSKIRSDFLDIFLLSRCKFLIGDSSGMSMAPMIFRKKSLYTNVSELHSISFIDSFYKPLLVLKKFKSLKTNEYIPYQLVLEKKLSEFNFIYQLNDIGYDVEDSTEEEIFQATKEMDHLINKNEYINFDEKLNKKFNDILIRFDINPLVESKISNFFLKKNNFLFD